MPSRLYTRWVHAPRCLAIAFMLTLFSPTTYGVPTRQPAQTAQRVADQVEQYLIESVMQQYDGEPVVSGALPSSIQSLEDCESFDIYMPPGRTIRSDTTVGVRCQQSGDASTYVRAKIAVKGTYFVAAQTIGANQAISEDMLESRSGDLLRLPTHAQTTPSQLVGRITTQRVPAGNPIRISATRSPNSIQRGDTVRIEVRGPGLSVTNQGEALTSADVGGTIQVRTANGKTIQGIVSESGTIFLNF